MERTISTSLTSDKMRSIRRGALLILDLAVERMDVTVPAAVSSPTTKAMTLNGSIFWDAVPSLGESRHMIKRDILDAIVESLRLVWGFSLVH
jgi:hypothetical protein